MLRSHTGEALIPMLENATYEDRTVFDANELNSTQSGDLELEQIGRDTLLPWQADGRRWHTRDSVDRKGERFDGNEHCSSSLPMPSKPTADSLHQLGESQYRRSERTGEK